MICPPAATAVDICIGVQRRKPLRWGGPRCLGSLDVLFELWRNADLAPPFPRSVGVGPNERCPGPTPRRSSPTAVCVISLLTEPPQSNIPAQWLLLKAEQPAGRRWLWSDSCPCLGLGSRRKHQWCRSSHLSGFEGGRSSFHAKAGDRHGEGGGGDYLKMLDNMQGVNLKPIGTPPAVFCVCFSAHPLSARRSYSS